MAQQRINVCVVCGPSGVGKGTLLKKTRECFSNTFGVAVSHTTRKPRPGETNGVDYNFTTRELFEKGIQNNEFVEYADVNGNYYGTSFESIKHIQTKNLICILEIDVQGARIIKDSGQINANYLFITCDGGINTLKKRLMGRDTETQEQINKRLNTAEKELKFLTENDTFFECIISNDDLHKSTQRLVKQFKVWYPWISNNIESKTEQDESKSDMANCSIVVCGPSGVGKGTLLRIVKGLLPETFGVACSHTTRKPRDGEIDGTHYRFVSREVFEKGIKDGAFVEYADVNGNYYGTSYEGIEHESKKNLICILEIDVQGADIIKKTSRLNAKYLFITCDGGLDTLKTRLKARNTESVTQIEKRLKTAEKEFIFFESNEGFFDCVVSNDVLEESAHRLVQQLTEWYPWIVTDNVGVIDDDEKKTRLVMEGQSIDALFNALQFDGASVYDIRAKDKYSQLHAVGAIHVSSSGKLNKFAHNERVFVYGDGMVNDDEMIKRLYGIAHTSNVLQFCVIKDEFDIFARTYPYLCTNIDWVAKDRIKYANCIGNTDHRLYIGGEVHAFDAYVIANIGITHIVNTKGTQSKLSSEIAKTIKYFDLKIDDSLEQSVFQLFDKASAFVHNALQGNESNRVLIHCGGGKSRSSTFTIAYLMKYRSQTLSFAYGTVSNARPKAFPNDAFLNQLAQYEIQIYGKSTKHFIENSKLRNKKRWKKVLDSWKIQL